MDKGILGAICDGLYEYGGSVRVDVADSAGG